MGDIASVVEYPSAVTRLGTRLAELKLVLNIITGVKDEDITVYLGACSCLRVMATKLQMTPSEELRSRYGIMICV